jgi:hypothetical protein
VLLTAGLVLFEPWTLFVDDRVDEAAPVSIDVEPSAADGAEDSTEGEPNAEGGPSAGSEPGADSTEPSTAATGKAAGGAGTKDTSKKDATKKSTPAKSASARSTQRAQAGPVTLLTGRFISHEHGTSGSATVLKLKDGSRVLRIKGLDTSNGPDLRVWLSDAPVRKGRAGWFNFDDGAHVDLGELKGNKGNQNYAVPASANLKTLRSVSIWCARFRVSFGAAALT